MMDVKRPGIRGGRWYRTRTGKIRYGKPPSGYGMRGRFSLGPGRGRGRRMYELLEDGEVFDVVEASSAEEALDMIDPEGGDYATDTGPVVVRFAARAVPDEDEEEEEEEVLDEAERVVVLPQDEPECERGADHVWVAPLRVVGGSETEPGTWIHGGGVFSHERCARCGAQREVDSWDTSLDGSPRKTVRYSDGDLRDFAEDIKDMPDKQIKTRLGVYRAKTYESPDGSVVLLLHPDGHVTAHDSMEDAREGIRSRK